MNTSGEPPGPFRVEIILSAERQLEEIKRIAIPLHLEVDVERSIDKALEILTADAIRVGEPIYDLHKMRMRIFRIMIPPLYFEYGVHHQQSECVIRRVVWLRSPGPTPK